MLSVNGKWSSLLSGVLNLWWLDMIGTGFYLNFIYWQYAEVLKMVSNVNRKQIRKLEVYKESFNHCIYGQLFIYIDSVTCFTWGSCLSYQETTIGSPKMSSCSLSSSFSFHPFTLKLAIDSQSAFLFL